MDDTDRKIIDILRRDGRTSYADLARQVGLSSPAVHERVGKLEAQGVITGFHATVDPEAIGLGVTAIVGVLTANARNEELLQALEAMTEIEACMFVAGEETYIVKIRVADIAALEHTLMAITQIPGVTRTRTTIVLSTKWEDRPGPLAALVPDGGDE